jgi:hypothetical protein
LRVCRDGATVSTVWLGMDHRAQRRPRRLFERMISQGDDVADFARFDTEAEALAAHAAAVAACGGPAD